MDNLKEINIGGKTHKVSPLIADRLVAANNEYKQKTGKDLSITSDFRSSGEQENIRKKFGYTNDSQVSGAGGLAMAAPPGKSFHNIGDAIDVADYKEAQPYLNKYQLKNAVPNDPGHFSVGETSKMQYANLADQVISARKKGKSDTEILDKLTTVLPAFKGAVEKAKKQGKNDSEIINQMSLIYSGIGKLPVASNPVPSGYKSTNEVKKEEPSLMKKVVGDISNPIKEFGKEEYGTLKSAFDRQKSGNIIEKSANPAITAVNLLGGAVGGVANLAMGGLKAGGRLLKAGAEKLEPENAKAVEDFALKAKNAITPVVGDVVKNSAIGVPSPTDIIPGVKINTPELIKKYFGDNVVTDIMDKFGIGKQSATGTQISTPKLLEKYGELQQNHPEVAKTLGNALNIGLWGLGAEAKAGEGATKSFMEPLSNSVDKKLENGIMKGIKPGIANVRQPGYLDKAKNAIKTMVGNTHLINVVDEMGNPVTKFSKASNFLGAVKDGFDQTKGKIFEAYDNLKNIAGDRGRGIDLNPIANEVRNFAEKNTVMKTEHPETYKKFIEAADALQKQGQYSLTEGQESIKQANEILKTFYRTGTGSADKDVKAFISARLRTAMDKVITGETDQSYQALKNAYGGFSSVEKDLVNMITRNAKKAPRGIYDVFGDMAASGELLRGIATMNPGDIASGFGMKALKEFYKGLNSDSNILKKAFRAVEGEVKPGGGAIEEGLMKKGKPPITDPKRLLGPGAMITPPPADTSGTIKGWQPKVLPREPITDPSRLLPRGETKTPQEPILLHKRSASAIDKVQVEKFGTGRYKRRYVKKAK